MSSTLRIVVLAALLIACAATAEARSGFSCVIDYAQTVSTCDPSPATGTGVFILNDAQTELSFDMTIVGLQGTESAAHFHDAPPGTNGDIVYFLPLGGHKAGVWKSTDPLPLTPALVAELFAGNIYVVVHTSYCGAGEVRGNLMSNPTPVHDTSWGRLKALYRRAPGAVRHAVPARGVCGGDASGPGAPFRVRLSNPASPAAAGCYVTSPPWARPAPEKSF